MFGGGLRPVRLAPLNRGCINKVVFLAVQCSKDKKETPIDKTGKKLYFTAKKRPWDNVDDDSDAVFKVVGKIPDAENEPNRVVFTLSEKQTYLDPTILYYFDILETDSDGTSNANRLAIGTFNIIPGANNKEAGGE